MDKMIGLNSFLHPKIPSSSRIPLLHIQPNLPLPSFRLKISKKTHLRFLLSAKTNSNNPTQEPKEPAQEMNYESSNNNGGGGGLNKDQPPPLINIKWGDLLLNPNPDNILAVGLTGLLTWASVQVLWQLFFISLVILVAALNVGSLSPRLGSECCSGLQKFGKKQLPNSEFQLLNFPFTS